MHVWHRRPRRWESAPEERGFSVAFSQKNGDQELRHPQANCHPACPGEPCDRLSDFRSEGVPTCPGLPWKDLDALPDLLRVT
jgi:hypothetical protein